MAIVNVGGKINNGETSPSLDYKYGPYISVAAAWDALGPNGADCACIGLTVGIQPTPTSPVEEYWFKSAASSASDLVKKLADTSYSIEVVEG